MQDFRRLLVWKRAHVFALSIRRATQAFPKTGYSDLKSQITRAAESIADNIVEGCASASRKEFAHYLNISIKSTSEVDYQLEYARDLGILAVDVWKPLAKEVVEIRKMLTALRRAVLNSINPPKGDSDNAKGENPELEKPRHPDTLREETRPSQQDPMHEETGPDA